MNYLKIGQYLANKRKSKNLTQKELASLLNVTDKAVSKWETGSNLPDISMFVKLAEVLETTIDELIAGEDKKSQEKRVVV